MLYFGLVEIFFRIDGIHKIGQLLLMCFILESYDKNCNDTNLSTVFEASSTIPSMIAITGLRWIALDEFIRNDMLNFDMPASASCEVKQLELEKEFRSYFQIKHQSAHIPIPAAS